MGYRTCIELMLQYQKKSSDKYKETLLKILGYLKKYSDQGIRYKTSNYFNSKWIIKAYTNANFANILFN
jgi:hypothetical protein